MLSWICSLVHRKWNKLLFEVNENKIPQDDKCEHDWEVVENGDYWRSKHIYCDEWKYCNLNPYGSQPYYILISEIVERAKNRVCVKCGECDNGVERFKLAYDKQERRKKDEKIAKRRRQAWAKQLWEDGCKNEKN